MKDIIEQIREKTIVIWGVGILQTDLEGMFLSGRISYYIDDDIQDKNLISVRREDIYSSKEFAQEKKKDIFFVICTDDQDNVISQLMEMGFAEEDYILGEELLINYSIYEKIHNRKISIWGTGNTYAYFEDEIKEYLPNVEYFIVSHKTEESFNGKQIMDWETWEKGDRDTYIVVASIYYNEIYCSLTDLGLKPGKDFVHLYTLLKLGNLSTRIHAVYQFDDRRKKSKDLLVILSGYKEFVWESVFPRIKAYVPKETDVCVVTSGLFNEQLREMCRHYQWSYMSTEKNHVSLVVNLAIWLHPDAEYIYKVDEDIFVTKGIFESMKNTYLQVQENSQYEVGFVTPLIPVNGYGYVRVLEIFACEQLWESRFGELKYTDCYCHHKVIHDNPQAARFLWGEENSAMDSLDDMAKQLKKRSFAYSVCSIRYSIGFILFHRNDWIRMGMFPVWEHSNMGSDEIYLCKYCLNQARAIIVDENSIAGHLSYGPQHKEMELFYREHRERFLLPKGDRYE